MIADALAALRCYDIIAQAWNNIPYYPSRKIAYEGEALQTRLHPDTLLLAMIQLAEAGDESAEFTKLLALLRAIVISPTVRDNDVLRRYAKLLEIYDAGPEWVDRYFSNSPDLKDRSTPGTMVYRILHAPQRIKKVLYDEKTDVLKDRFIGVYSPQQAKERFTDFTPRKPLKTGYIFVLDQGTPPPFASIPMVSADEYESRHKDIVVSYEGKRLSPPKKVFDKEKRVWVEEPQEPFLIEERIPQKGEYFCVANPHNARIAIYETHSYTRHGSYRVAGRHDMVDVYLHVLDITVVDLVTKKTLLKNTIRPKAEQTYTVPSSIAQGDSYIPPLFFDRHSYLEEKLRGVIK